MSASCYCHACGGDLARGTCSCAHQLCPGCSGCLSCGAHWRGCAYDDRARGAALLAGTHLPSGAAP